MQYGAEIFPYKRIKKANKDRHKGKEINWSSIVTVIIYFFSALFTSRVIMVNLMAPFGIAFLVAAIISEDNKFTMITGIGCTIGYISLYNNIRNIWIYFVITGTVVFSSYVFNKIKTNKKIYILYGIIFLELFLYNRFILHISTTIAFLNAIFEIACIFPIYYIINYSITCIKQLKTKHLYTGEEIISMAITLSLIVAGTWGISIYGVSVRNILALTSIVMIGYIKGSSAGGACGIAMGTIVGLSTSNMVTFVGVYGVCGLISGIFKSMGKWISGLSFVVIFAILKLYSDIGVQFQFKEALVALFIYCIIPNTLYKKMELELDWEMKQENVKENYVNNIKDLFLDRLTGFSDVLLDMSVILENLSNNEKLEMKTKSSALVENLADRVCGNCNMNSMCWKRENFYTYSALEEMIRNYQNKKKVVPDEIDRKCIKRAALIRNTEEIVNNYIIDETWKHRLTESRRFLATQIGNISASVNEMREEFNESIKFNRYIEKDIRRILNKNNIKYRDVFCYNNKKDRLIIKLSMNACGGKQKCVKQILPLINNVTGKMMSISEECCNLDVTSRTCAITLEETPKYHIASYAGILCKDGEKFNGDSYAYDKLKDGTYITIISDGMGSGPQAEQESSAAVELIKKFAEAGFSKLTAINTINSLMTIKFSEEEKFSTVDLNSVDLYSGEANFMKVGAVASFIKSKDKVDIIKSKTLPIGVLDKVDVDIVNKQVHNGDLIIMLSDGVLDYNVNEAGKIDWLLKYLRETNFNKPEELCKDIVNKVKELSNGKIKDDMTVVVSKVYALY
ncbi:stage II sporulation protein E [Clostridium rectalis]|uniref:stage II sporulation protein E n=1 Tax=Clostridium rectalis TaxID=2040295 RepID=UPI000F642F26|nr:stage II sporulation protein E [Clostridium rectalis]